MSVPVDTVSKEIESFLTRAKKMPETLTSDLSIYTDGLGLDSLEVAELSVVLEDKYGTDPFTAGAEPQTVGDVLAFYDSGS